MATNKDLLLVLKSSGLGEGEPDLGMKLLNSFLDMLIETDNIPEKVICLNAGIYLTTTGSSVEKQMNEFVEKGSRVLSCGTCLDYYDRRDKLMVGEVTNMRDIVLATLRYKKLVSP